MFKSIAFFIIVLAVINTLTARTQDEILTSLVAIIIVGLVATIKTR
ncbi:hypothetical protein LCGC14_1395610 [marine sediment metagenome]|uniref:Uncharacterized protein n=1 Tax=marine sediment metagenome TaxID=412755 RepID=A0A0F9JYP1_9ZZZZ